MIEAAASTPPAPSDQRPVHAATSATSGRPDWRRLVLESALVGLASVALAAWTLGIWRADLGVPLRYAPVDDTKFYLLLVKSIIDHGWYLSNSSLGWPFGQHLAEFPQGADNLNLLLIRGLALFSPNPALVLNLFFLLTFALAGVAAHVVLRSEGVSAPAAVVVSVLFALLPYHFFRGESHLLLSAYYAVPLAAYLFLGVLAQRPLFARRSSPQRSRIAWASQRSLLTIVLCVVIGSDNLYYATFAAILLVAAVLISLLLAHWRAAIGGALALTLVAATLAVNLMPTLADAAQHGVNAALERSAASDERSNEVLGLRLTNLLLPAPNGRIPGLAALGARYDKAIAPGYCDGCYASLGIVGTVGFLWLVACGLGTLVGAASWFGSRRIFRHAAAGAMIAFVVGTVGGFSSLIEFFVTPDIRGWNRMSLLIAFFSLLSVAVLLDSFRRRLGARPRSAFASGLALVAVLVFGTIEQTSAPDAAGYAAAAREYRSDAAFVATIQARLPRGAAVFVLPYVPFPEGYPDTPCCGSVPTYATKYEPLRAYLHSTTLRWSYGAIKGRAADWPAGLAAEPLAFVLPAVAAEGLQGLWLDPAGFEPATASRVQAALRSLLREAPLESSDHDLWFFDLRPYAARLRRSLAPALLALLRVRTLHPLRSVCAPGGLKLINPSRFARAGELSVRRVGAPPYGRALTLAPGATYVPVPGTATAAGRILYDTLIDERLTSITASAGGGGAAGRVVVGLTGPGCPG